ncbi:MAG: hypothetical protein KJZ85_01720 [Rhodobacteraceae bacterium]|jgi:hypothetical protein|nr:hypothetical protein [Paracoccaceae bacterium]
MTHNLSLGPEADVMHGLAVLRASQPVGPIVAGQPLGPGVSLVLDPEGQTEAEAIAAPGALMGLRLRAIVPGRWAGLHIVLGPLDLTDRHVIGVVLRTRAPAVTTLRIALRSGREGGFDDCDFPKRLVAFGEDSTHVDLLQTARHPDTLPLQAPWRELVLFLPPAGCELVIQDLRLFVV